MARGRREDGSLDDPIDIPSDSDASTNTDHYSDNASAYGTSPQPTEVVNLRILTVARVQELVRFRRRLRIIAGRASYQARFQSRGRHSRGHRVIANRAVLALRDIVRTPLSPSLSVRKGTRQGLNSS
ncbi:hypothetical protein PGTUg99_028830 [Puccinia graminis f. sp. tritici]|uniref:Uncharacterized protein n=1 Tax=Puccinia graminis f. sp. tritici TaxID=56615 RepID=A0A5B0RMK9_PUCGR|nr:hypothetical protein PGTUg99_028830 [Puccinia graminis f. sp. tritici]